MTQYSRPNETVFASGAKPGELESFPDIARGWGITFDQTDGIPPMEWFNSLFKRNDEAVRYLLQRGVPEWSATEDYPVGAYVQESGKLWRSITANIGKRPTSYAALWEALRVTKSELDDAYASLAHAHSQIFALPFVPPRIAQEAATLVAYREEHGADPFEEILAFEVETGSRIIAENDSWLCFAPYAPQWQMEAWAVPKRAVSTLSELHADELHDLAPILKQLVGHLSDFDINHNLSFEQGIESAQRLTVKVRGRNVVSPWGGLEVSTGVIINTIPSEAAAEWYRRPV